MIRRILLFLLVFMVIAFVALWFLSGGWGKMKLAASRLSNPIDLILGDASSTSTGGTMALPWQINAPQGADLSQYQEDANNIGNEPDYTEPSDNSSPRPTIDPKTFGNPSPHARQIEIVGQGGAAESEPSSEYIELHADAGNTAPINLNGWTLQSAVTGTRIPILTAASPFLMGIINSLQVVVLNPDGRLIVNSGQSPVGVSFRENICTGYLQQYQNFHPDLNRACPDPTLVFPETPENLQRYGSACFDYIQSLPHCAFNKSIPPELSPLCKAYISNTFSYNGCVQMFRTDPNFQIDLWRVYLNSPRDLWQNTHDIIRLLDQEGRTVDVLTY